MDGEPLTTAAAPLPTATTTIAFLTPAISENILNVIPLISTSATNTTTVNVQTPKLQQMEVRYAPAAQGEAVTTCVRLVTCKPHDSGIHRNIEISKQPSHI
ncbi:unnamed protein product [Dibothriocephalus latus]|uniref:Uncharacterized protein n=1 Tax=Dibothriocephalus latus TaxID=60516 RepID=A0A3P6SNZ5_DIBLA|nr:unnamed protein product [Dibothriocephalus latus]